MMMTTDSTATSRYPELLDLAPLPISLSAVPPPGSLQAILDGDVRLAHFRGLLEIDYCDAVMNVLGDVNVSSYDVNLAGSQVVKFGPTAHFGFDEGDGLDHYFREAESADAELRNRFEAAGIVDPREIMIALLKHMWAGPVEIPREGDRKYFAGVMRSVTEGTIPHVDFAQRTPDLAIGKVLSQGSILFYLRMPPAGGGVRVFDKRPASPMPFDGLEWEGVAGLEFAGVTPAAGDVVVFPTTYAHAVEPVIIEGDRVTVSAFFGPLPDGRIILWS